QALPELALRARPLPERHVSDLVAVRGAAWKVAPDDVARRLRAPDGGKALTPGRARLADDVAGGRRPPAPPPAARPTGVGAADRLEEDLQRRHSERQHERPVPVVREEPVVPGAQRTGEAEQQGLVASARDLEEHLALLPECDLAVVDRARDARESVVGES